MMHSGWYCPYCNAHHAPHIDTCPRQNGRGVRYVPTKESGGHVVHEAVIPLAVEHAGEVVHRP